MPTKNRFAEMMPELTAWRHDLHRHPEILYEVHRTAARVAELLREFGCDEVVEGIGRTGVVGVIRGRTDKSGRVIGLRADMDALPITETTGLDYASLTKGAMHACGHDGHTTMLLGATKYLAETRNFDGTAVVIFQPAEEGGAGGRAMVEDGLVTRWGIDEFYALHNMPGLPTGEFAIRDGAMMAGTDEIFITVHGRGGHAAKPHETRDPLLAAAQIIVALQSIVARNLDPLASGVVSVSTLETDSVASNVISDAVRMTGTIRSLDEASRALMGDAVRRVVAGVAQAMDVTAECEVHRGYPVTVNHTEGVAHAVAAARAVTPQVRTDLEPLMAGEDFSYMLLERPGAYIFLGNGETSMLHSPSYVFDDEAMPAGASWFAELVEQRLPAAG